MPGSRCATWARTGVTITSITAPLPVEPGEERGATRHHQRRREDATRSLLLNKFLQLCGGLAQVLFYGWCPLWEGAWSTPWLAGDAATPPPHAPGPLERACMQTREVP